MNIFYPLEIFAEFIVYSVLNLIEGSHLAESLVFIIADLLKIFILLFVMIFLVSYIRTYFKPEIIKRKFNKNNISYYFGASFLGVISPFCSCSSIPIFIGFIEGGVPLGITFAFLITSPLVNEAAIAVLLATVGIKATIYYVISGVLIGVIGGLIISKLKLEKYVEEYIYKIKSKDSVKLKETQKQKVDFAFEQVKSIVSKVWLYVIIGVSIGGFLHGYLPEEFISDYLGKGNIFAVPMAVLVGVPLYSNVLGTIPIIESLISKGLPIGTGLAFLMSVTALSFPEMVILKKVIKVRLIAIFVLIVTIGIIINGYILNLLL